MYDNGFGPGFVVGVVFILVMFSVFVFGYEQGQKACPKCKAIAAEVVNK